MLSWLRDSRYANNHIKVGKGKDGTVNHFVPLVKNDPTHLTNPPLYAVPMILVTLGCAVYAGHDVMIL